jgi:hypothetical protein
MNAYEKLLTEFSEELIIDEVADLPSNLKGLYVLSNRCNLILLNGDLKLVNEKTCILAEEIGHHCTSIGNILDQSKIKNRKQEKKARRWAVNKLIKVEQFVDAYKEGVRCKAELADFLNVTEPFLDFAIEHFKNLYGTYHVLGNYIIYFNPLGVYSSLISIE